MARETTFRFIERKPEVISLVGGEERVVRGPRVITGRKRRTPREALESLKREEERLKAQEAARKAEEKRKADLEARRKEEAARRERIEAGTIAGQVSAREEAAEPRFMRTPEIREFTGGRPEGFREPVLRATGRFFSEIGRGIGVVGGALIGRREISELRDPFKVFEFVGPQKGERVIREPAFGTVTPETARGFKETTLFEIQEKAQREVGIPEKAIGLSPGAQAAAIAGEEARRIRREFTERVAAKEITPEAATEAAQKEFQKSFAERVSRVKVQPDLTVRAGEEFARAARKGAITAGLIGVSLASPALTAGIGGVSLAAAGQLSVRAGEEFARGERFQSAITLGQAGLFAVGGASAITGVLGPTGTIPKQITQLRIKELQQRPLTLGGAEIGKTQRGDVLIRVTGTRGTGVAAQEVELLSPVFRTGITEKGAERFAIAGGRGISKTRVTQFGLEGIVPAEQAVIKSTEAFGFTARGISGLPSTVGTKALRVVSPEDVSAAFGRLDIVRGEKVTRGFFGGISRRGEEFFDVVGGPVSKARVGITEKEIRRTIAIKPSAAGKIRRLKGEVFFPEEDIFKVDIGAFDISRPKLVGRPSPEVVTRPVSDIGQAGIQATKRVTEIVKPTVDVGVKAPPVVGALGTQRQIDISEKAPILKTTLDVGTILAPKEAERVLTGLETGVVTRPERKRRLRPAFGLGTEFFQPPIQETGIVQELFPTPRPKGRFKLEPVVAPTISAEPFIGAPIAPIGFGIGLPKFRPSVSEVPEPRRITRRRRRKPGRIAPSLTGITVAQLGDIFGPLPKPGKLGLLPTQIRFQPEPI